MSSLVESMTHLLNSLNMDACVANTTAVVYSKHKKGIKLIIFE